MQYQIKNKIKMMELEQMSWEELNSLKGGIWVETENGWEWFETYRLDTVPEKE